MTPERFAETRRTLSQRLITVLARLFLGLGSWRDPDAEVFVAQAVPLVHGAQRLLAALIANHLAAQATTELGWSVAPPGVPDTAAVNLRHGVDADAVYRRPFTSLYTALADGQTLGDAVAAGRLRLERIAEADLQQTHAHAARAAMRALPAPARPRYWKRVLVGDESCALCVVASTNRYRIEELNPIHPGCDCDVRAVFRDDATDTAAGAALLERVHAAVRELTGQADPGGRTPDYRHLLVDMTAVHGELGPLLVRPHHRFTGPHDLAES